MSPGRRRPRQCRLLELEAASADERRPGPSCLEEPLEDFSLAVLPMLPRRPVGETPVARWRTRASWWSCCAAGRARPWTRAPVWSSRATVGSTPINKAIPRLLLATSAVRRALARAGSALCAPVSHESRRQKLAKWLGSPALLVGYGAGAVNPCLAFEAIDAINEMDVPRAERAQHYIHALDKGSAEVAEQNLDISTMPVELPERPDFRGPSGSGRRTIDRWFPGTASRVGGIGGLPEIAHESLLRHAAAFEASAGDIDDVPSDEDAVDVGGVYARGENQRERTSMGPAHGRQPSEGRSPGRRARL